MENAKCWQEQCPRAGRRNHDAVGVRPRSWGQLQLGSQPGTIVNLAIKVHKLREADEEATLHCRFATVIRIPAPRSSALKVHRHQSIAGNREFDWGGDELIFVGNGEYPRLALVEVPEERGATIAARHGLHFHAL